MLISLADAACIIAASSTFTEPFVVPMDRRRLDWVHKNLAGDRYSDHCALLNAFQSWNDARLLSGGGGCLGMCLVSVCWGKF